MTKLTNILTSIPLTFVCAVLVLSCDLATPVDASVWVFYLPLLLVASRSNLWSFPFIYSAICSVFIAVGFFYTPDRGQAVEMAYVGRCLGIFVVWVTATVIVQGKRGAAALAASEKRFLSFMDNSSAVAWMKDEHFRYIYINKSFEQVFQTTLAAIKGKTDFDLWPKEQAEELRKHDTEVFTIWQKIEAEVSTPTPDGNVLFWRSYKFPFVDEAGKKFIGGMASDITQHQKNEEALRDSELRFRSIWESSVDGMRLTDQNGITFAVNKAYSKLVDMPGEELVGSPFSIIYSGDQDAILKLYRERFATRNVATHLERRLSFKSGKTVDFEVANSFLEFKKQPPLLLGIFRDITQRKQHEAARLSLERKLLDGQKLESLGVMAGGIAHDFNNLLTGILGNASISSMQLPKDSPVRPYLTNIEAICTQAADLCKQMLAYSGKGHFVIQKININSLIEEMTQLIQISLNKKVELRFKLDPAVLMIEADPSQIRQAIMHLLINSSEAIGKNTGTITISTGLVQADEAYLSETYFDLAATPGEYVYFEVSDTGCGIAPEIKQKIFEPFFSTKFTGRGLGLAAVLGIVRGHKGSLKIQSIPGDGTHFKILFPRADSTPQITIKSSPSNANWQGGGTILVVDDELHVRDITAQMLQVFGYKTLVAKDGVEGVEIFKNNADEIRAVVLDMTMPRLNGEETFREIQLIRPSARVLLVSGYNEQEATNRFYGRGLAGFLQKPFKAAELSAKLRQILQDEEKSDARL